MKEFLDEQNKGLDELVDYLSFRLHMMRYEQLIQDETLQDSKERIPANQLNSSTGNLNNNAHSSSQNRLTMIVTNKPELNEMLTSPSTKRRSRHIQNLNMGSTTDDIHVV